MKESILKIKSYNFALQIIKSYQLIVKNDKEYTLSRQLLRSGTSVGANKREAEFAQSNKDFISKMSIALKEANETDYWIALLHDSLYLKHDLFLSLTSQKKELIKMLVTTINTMKSKSNNY
ncbi:four helix bundle protein [Olleya sp. Bg11-27]|uniref:four helix bundle protein n=1 Tax=Olleya sp. Bg11-27 TaxID=2058135 RepID=UPI000C3115CF|nr:four helix bundle protein [Olleya sp. Bg11-27]AUC76061.1 four helix bundle protein [Olleya sp. Bg11-27]